MDEHTRLDRVRGCLLAGAVGDALGAPVEFLSDAEIRSGFPDGIVREYRPAFGRLGAITDDTQMMLFTAEGLVLAHERGRDRGIWHPPSMVYDAYLRWLRTQEEHDPGAAEAHTGWLLACPELWSRRAPGTTCLVALARGVAGTLEAPVNGSKGCGGVMRAAPAGLIGYPDPFRLGCETAALTHGHPSGYLSAGALAHAVSRLLAGAELREAVESALPFLRTYARHEECEGLLCRALELSRSGPASPDAVRSLGAGWVGEEALAIGVYCALAAEGLEEALRVAVSHGGDSDSTGMVTGNLLGAARGVDAIPERWLAPLELREAIEETATRLGACLGG